MKVGDLVRYKEEHPYKKLGIVIGAHYSPAARARTAYNIAWNGKYGTFWTQIRHLELLNESG